MAANLMSSTNGTCFNNNNTSTNNLNNNQNINSNGYQDAAFKPFYKRYFFWIYFYLSLDFVDDIERIKCISHRISFPSNIQSF